MNFFNPESLPITIQEIHFNYPKVSFDEYLPVIYQDQLFLQKYLAIYQSLYMDIENQIEEFKASLDFDYANEQTLRKIGTWLGIAVDDFEKRILKGRIYHESKNGGIAFYSLSEMVFVLEELFDEIHYPMKSVDPRNFGKKELAGSDGR